MRWFVSLVLALAFGVMGCGETAGAEGSEFPEAESAALQAAEEYLEAFNACGDGDDWEAWVATFNYPHVRFNRSGAVRMWDSPEDYLETSDCEVFRALNPDWHHSTWDSVDVVQSGANKVHIAILVNRRDAEGKVLQTFETFHIMTNQDGHWGTLSRSSYGPL